MYMIQAKESFKDEVTHGFDTEAKSLVISDHQLLQYISSATKSLSHAVKSHSATPPTTAINKLNVSRLTPKTRDCQGPLGKKAYVSQKSAYRLMAVMQPYHQNSRLL